MTEEKSIRLAKAAGELNVAYSHLVELLNSKGYTVENKPTTKITEEMYNLLLKEYGKDKVMKEKADLVNIGLARKSDKPEESITEKIKDTPEPLLKKIDEEIHEKKEPKKTEKKEEPPKTEEEVVRRRKEKIEEPKIVGKIDLEKPRKTKKVKAEKEAANESVTKEKPAAKKTKKTEQPVEETIIEPQEIKAEEKTIEKENHDDGIELIERKKVTLEGPKIMGKIELKEEKKPEKRKDFPPAKPDADGGRSKRKRIKKTGERINVDKLREEQQRDERQQQDRGRFERKPLVDPTEQERIIQEQIRNTLAKLSGNKGRQGKPKFKKTRREDAEQIQQAAQGNNLQVAEFTSLSELASLMNVSAIELVQKCFNLGMMVSINQRLDAEIIELLGEEFGFKISFIDVTTEAEEQEEPVEDPALLEHRPPIVTIMGHVDHGKTSLLDYIRETNVVAGEKGGITQHIGAYEVVLPNTKKIAFLDTPGHEAFTAMRARGAKLTDIAVIVIAADDQIMPQTREAISHAQAAGVPMVFAINKIDKPGANPDKIKEQLSQMNILVEDWGGKYQSQEISAKSGLHVETLLEKILFEAELLDLKANPDKDANGTIIEALLDKGRGYISNIMVQEGTLRVGDMMVAGPFYGRVKAMFNERSQKVINAGPSTPVLVLGLNGAPQAGEKFKIYEDEDEAKNIANKRLQILREQGIRTRKHITLEEIGRRKALGTFRELNIIIKADVDGSSEALTDSLQKLTTPEVQVNIIFKGVGQITESDVMLASASDAIIVGFQVRPSSSVRKLAEKEGVEIRMYSIIYNAIEEVKAAMEGLLAPKTEEKITCTVEIREVFKISKVGSVAGCYVQEGKITRNTKIRILRDGVVIHTGHLASLKRFKDDAKEVASGMECGLNIHNFNDIQPGDLIEGYEEVEVKRTL